LVFYEQHAATEVVMLRHTDHASRVLRKAVFEGDRQLRRSCFRFAEEFRALRLRAGLSQAEVARSVGVNRSVISRLEHGRISVAPQIRARATALLGAEFRMSLYPIGAALIQDEAQVQAIERILEMRHPRWRATVEAPVPGPGRRSTDLRLECGSDIVLIEYESRIGKLEEIVRECHDKREAVAAAVGPDRRVHVLLALSMTKRHRALVGDHPATIVATFPLSNAEIETVLVGPDGRWPGDGILWVNS
jgi:transcriptional regulator with XRE-family HTH domain